MVITRKQQYLLGAAIALSVYIILRLLNGGYLGVANIPLIVVMSGPFLPLFVPFILLGFKRRQMAIGALIMVGLTFAFSFIP